MWRQVGHSHCDRWVKVGIDLRKYILHRKQDIYRRGLPRLPKGDLRLRLRYGCEKATLCESVGCNELDDRIREHSNKIMIDFQITSAK